MQREELSWLAVEEYKNAVVLFNKQNLIRKQKVVIKKPDSDN